jgi:hypothetical protein
MISTTYVSRETSVRIPLKHRVYPHPRESRMTVVAGFWCKDGVVMIGDQQVTKPGVATHPESKLFGIKWGNGRGILSYSGSSPTWGKFYKEICGRLEADPFPQCGPAELEKAFTESLQAAKPKTNDGWISVLFGLWIDGEKYPSLWCSEVTKSGVYPIENIRKVHVMGQVSPLTEFLQAHIRHADVSGLSVNQAAIHGIRIVNAVSIYDAQYVGLGMDGIKLTRPEDSMTQVNRMQFVGGLAGDIVLVDHWLQFLFHKVSDERYPPKLDQVLDAVRKYRARITGKDADF